jgi:hypothetical protein
MLAAITCLTSFSYLTKHTASRTISQLPPPHYTICFHLRRRRCRHRRRVSRVCCLAAKALRHAHDLHTRYKHRWWTWLCSARCSVVHWKQHTQLEREAVRMQAASQLQLACLAAHGEQHHLLHGLPFSFTPQFNPPDTTQQNRSSAPAP